MLMVDTSAGLLILVMVMDRYMELDAKLRSDPRLAEIYVNPP